MIEDLTTGESATRTVFATTSTATAKGWSAEWVVERFQTDGSPVLFVGFDQVRFAGCVAEAPYGEHGVEGATIYDLSRHNASINSAPGAWVPFTGLDIKVAEWEPIVEGRIIFGGTHRYMYCCRWTDGARGKVDKVRVDCRAQQRMIENDRYEQALASVGLMSIYRLFDGLPKCDRVKTVLLPPHANLTEISAGLDLLWRNDLDPAKVVLGLGFYGRSFTLKDPSCNIPGCPFINETGLGTTSGGADPGKCTGTSGMLSNYEISRVIDAYSPDVIHDEEAGVNWITWNSNQWVSFDNAVTLIPKREMANSLCLAGTLAWALDLGGLGTMSAPANLDPNAGMGGVRPDGSDSGSGDVYIGPEIYEGNSTVNCVPPCNLIFPPSTLPTPTTIVFPPYTTSLEIAWPTTTITTLDDGTVTTSTEYLRNLTTTTLTIPPVTTDKIDWWNLNLTSSTSKTTFTLQSSILPPPFYITNSPEAARSRGITPPPFPWSTITHPSEESLPTLTFIEGPPSPTCLTGCGHKCHIFCEGVCERDCSGGGSDFYDPDDPDPPTKPGCRGPDCHNVGYVLGPNVGSLLAAARTVTRMAIVLVPSARPLDALGPTVVATEDALGSTAFHLDV
ncbi:hypothetical protein BDV38DRAFT_276621 [Aspergillus pseudotamarii]|uniref:GH18 domain-containing protein n=1 Tax=Aspergillus pseudotamarii TaxID=132259 RepID=A0A5N6TB70_ASPPS|nr:uncharacterized protein BDV38DRAFT_276621 [Aspergillus pseudotamarii]KAE8143536.1 hypothetical protein BDV38DRAFT_276621 [Aspergillus pseudotamarii]